MRYESPTWGVELSRRRQTFFFRRVCGCTWTLHPIL